MLVLSLLKGVGSQLHPSRSWGFSLKAPAARPREGEHGVTTPWGGEMLGPWFRLMVQPWDQSQGGCSSSHRSFQGRSTTSMIPNTGEGGCFIVFGLPICATPDCVGKQVPREGGCRSKVEIIYLT